MRIGIDFDNTIIDYDRVFAAQAIAMGLVPPDFVGGKPQVRDTMRQSADGEKSWMRLQGRIYGAEIGGAVLMDGVADFFARCRDREDISLFIVSHKSEFGHYDPDRVKLRDAALDWMTDHQFFASSGFSIPQDHVYFEATRDEKIRRITALQCTHFIDDLVEVLADKSFPAEVQGILFTNGAEFLAGNSCLSFARWDQIESAIFSGQR